MNSGDVKVFEIRIETEHIKGHEFCLYDIDCKFVNSIRDNKMVIKTGFQPISSDQFPQNRIKVISMDEKGKDINRYKTKSEGEIDLPNFTSFMFGTILQYQCGLGRMFELNEKEQNILIANRATNYSAANHRFHENISISCNWDGHWSIPNFFVPTCVCKC